jgi:hypothetical protein
LLHGISIAYGHGVVFQCLMVYTVIQYGVPMASCLLYRFPIAVFFVILTVMFQYLRSMKYFSSLFQTSHLFSSMVSIATLLGASAGGNAKHYTLTAIF